VGSRSVFCPVEEWVFAGSRAGFSRCSNQLTACSAYDLRCERDVTVLRSTQSACLGELHRLFQDVSGKTMQRDLQAVVTEDLLKAAGVSDLAVSWR
jgi:hypothetical protein